MSSTGKDLNHLTADSASFAFHAQAIGLSASLKKPNPENIPGQASVSLSQAGGESYSAIQNFNWKGLITFDDASAYVTGSVEKDASGVTLARNTLSTVTVRNLNVANMVHADLVVARVSSRHVPRSTEGEITFAGSMINNLTIGGEPVNVAFDTRPFNLLPTYQQFVDDPDVASRTNARHPLSGDVISASLVSGAVTCRAGECNGYIVTIKDFGTIYIAQVLIKPSYRRVSMLRFDLGCPIDGAVEVCGGESNGAEYWP